MTNPIRQILPLFLLAVSKFTTVKSNGNGDFLGYSCVGNGGFDFFFLLNKPKNTLSQPFGLLFCKVYLDYPTAPSLTFDLTKVSYKLSTVALTAVFPSGERQRYFFIRDCSSSEVIKPSCESGKGGDNSISCPASNCFIKSSNDIFIALATFFKVTTEGIMGFPLLEFLFFSNIEI